MSHTASRWLATGLAVMTVAVALVATALPASAQTAGTESESTVCDDSTRLAYAAPNELWINALWIVDADGCNRIRIDGYSDGHTTSDPLGWSPDGTHFAYLTDNWERETEALWIVDRDGSNPIRITDKSLHDEYYRFRWSPDGTHFAYAVVQYYGAAPDELWIVNNDGSNPIRITDRFNRDYQLKWSPDGTRLAYTVSDGLWIVDNDGSNPIRITDRFNRDYPLRWSPDGTRIAYTLNLGLWIAVADGSNSIKITEQHWRARFSWSPDGTRIAYEERPTEKRHVELWMTGRDGSNRTKITDRVSIWNSSDYFYSKVGFFFGWSPDGAHFAYRTPSQEPSSDELWIADGDGSNPIKISELITRDISKSFDWSPDGTQFVYMATKRPSKDSGWGWWHQNSKELWIADGNGSNPKIVTDNFKLWMPHGFIAQLDGVDWSPDGTRLTYSTDSNELWIADWDGSNPTQIAGDSYSLGWSPGGARIAYRMHNQLWIADSDGSNPTRIHPSGGRAHFLGWAPVLVAGADTGSVSSDGSPSVAVSRGSVENDFEICRVGAAVCSWVVGSGSGWTPGEEFFVRCGDFVDTSRDVPVVYRDRFVDSGGGLSWGESICYSNGAHVVEVWTGVDGSVSVTVPAPDGTVPSTSPPSSAPPTTDPVVPASLPEIAFVGHRLKEGKPVMTFPPPAGAVSYDLRYRASARSEWTVVEGVDVRCRRGTLISTNWCSYSHPVAVRDGWWYAVRGVSSSGRGPWSGPRSVDVPPPVSQPSSSSSRTAHMPPPLRHPVLSGDSRPNVQGGSITVGLPVLEPVGGWNMGKSGGAGKGEFWYTKSDPYSANSATWYFQGHDQVLSSGRYRIEVFIPNKWRPFWCKFWCNRDADPLPTATVKYSIYSRNSTDGTWKRLNTFSVDQSNRSGWVTLGTSSHRLQFNPTGQLAVKLEVRDATGGIVNVDRMRLTFVSLTDADQKKVADRAAVLSMRQSLEDKALLGGANLNDSLRYLCGQLSSGTPRGQQVEQNLKARGVLKGQWGLYRAAAELGLNFYKGHWKSVLSTALNRAGLHLASLVVGLADVAGAMDDFNKLMQADYLTEVGIETKACPLKPWDSKWD